MGTALVFPPPPLTIGQEYTGPNGVAYTWDGEAWACGAGISALWTDNKSTSLMSPVPPGRSLSLAPDSAVHFGDPTVNACPCIESDGDDLTFELPGTGTFEVEIAGTVAATIDATGLRVVGTIAADASTIPPGGAVPAGDLAGSSYPSPVVKAGAITAAKIAPGVIPTVPTALPPTGPVPAGDLAGSSYPSPVVAPGAITAAKIAPGVIPTVPTTLPPSGAAGGDLAGSTYPAPVIAPGAVTAAKIAAGVIPTVPTTLPPSGAAGGDLAGSTYPAPVIAAGAVTAAKIAGGVIPTTLPPNGAAGGDLAGSTYPAPAVAPGAITAAKIARGGTVYAKDQQTAGATAALTATAVVAVEKSPTLDQTRPVIVTATARLRIAKVAAAAANPVTVTMRLAVGGTGASDGTVVATLDAVMGATTMKDPLTLAVPVTGVALYVPATGGATRFKLFASVDNVVDFTSTIDRADLTVVQLS